MAPGNNYENVFKVWRFLAQNTAKLWQIILYDFREI